MPTVPGRWDPSATTKITPRLRDGQLDRRALLRLLGGAGLSASGLVALQRRAAFAQDGGGGTPMPAATPVIGRRDDGSTVWRVQSAAMRMEQAPIVEIHSFFPGEITIAEGDAIWFDFGMPAFHAVSFLSGADVLPVIVPDPEVATPTADGPPKMILNPAVTFPQGGDTYDGTGIVSSGLDIFRDPAQPYVVTFTAAGTYEYVCVVHFDVMIGTVVVQPAGTSAPRTQAEYDEETAAAIAAGYAAGDAEIAKYAEATATENADGTTAWEATVGAGGATPVRVQAFLPMDLEIKVGDSVTWVHRSPDEPHTVSFVGAGEAPPEDPVELFADGAPKFVQNPLVLFPAGGTVWSGTGWLNSGFIGQTFLGQPTEFTVTFDTPGDYIPYCFLHGSATGERMAGTLKVVPR